MLIAGYKIKIISTAGVLIFIVATSIAETRLGTSFLSKGTLGNVMSVGWFGLVPLQHPEEPQSNVERDVMTDT